MQKTLFLLFIAFNIFVAFLDNIITLTGLHIFFLLLIALKGQFEKYIKLTLFLYIFSIFIVASNGYFGSGDRDLWIFNKSGLLSGCIITGRVLVLSSAAFFYRTFTSYYDIANIFSKKRGGVGYIFSIMLILVFMFIRECKGAVEEFNISFTIRCGSKLCHPFKYIYALARFLIQRMFSFASCVSTVLESREAL